MNLATGRFQPMARGSRDLSCVLYRLGNSCWSLWLLDDLLLFLIDDLLLLLDNLLFLLFDDLILVQRPFLLLILCTETFPGFTVNLVLIVFYLCGDLVVVIGLVRLPHVVSRLICLLLIFNCLVFIPFAIQGLGKPSNDNCLDRLDLLLDLFHSPIFQLHHLQKLLPM